MIGGRNILPRRHRVRFFSGACWPGRDRSNLCAIGYWIPWYGLTQLLLACTGGVQPTAPIHSPSSNEVLAAEQTVALTVVTPSRSTSIGQLLAEAGGLAAAGRTAHAARQFQRLATLEPMRSWPPTASYRAGLAYDAEEMWGESADAFDAAANASSQRTLQLDARLRATRVRLHLGQWRRAGHSAQAILASEGNQSPVAEIVARTGLSLSALDAGQLVDAEYHVAKGLSLVEHLGLDRGGGLSKDVAVLYFALGEARRVTAERAHLDARPAHFTRSLETRCERLLEAQSAYSDAMRGRDAHWSTLAGLRVGQLYADLHRELTNTPPPRQFTASEQALFEAAMRYRYSVLLDKAVTMVEHTVALAERTAVAPDWKRRAVEVLHELDTARGLEKKLLSALPVSPIQLRQALERIADRGLAQPASDRD